MSGGEYTDKMDAENEALRKDAARYRWLANDCDGDAQDDIIFYLSGNVLSKEQIDEAIDAAMKVKP